MPGPYCYEFARPMVTVDAAVFRWVRDGWRVLLIRRGRPPFEGMWAFPGGFVDLEETLEAAVARELEEETGLTKVVLEQLHTFGDPGRDPRGRTVSVVFVGVREDEGSGEVLGLDDASEAAWHAVDAPPPLAFDHDKVLARALQWLGDRSH